MYPIKYRRSGNFRVKNNSHEIFHVDKFSRFRSIHEIFLTVGDCNMDERLESLWLLVYYQVSGELGIAHCSHRSDIYLGECGLACKLIHWSSPRNLFFMCLIFAVGLDCEIILTAKFSRSTVGFPIYYICACIHVLYVTTNYTQPSNTKIFAWHNYIVNKANYT